MYFSKVTATVDETLGIMATGNFVSTYNPRFTATKMYLHFQPKFLDSDM